MTYSFSTQITLPQSLTDMLDHRNKAVAAIHRAKASLDEADSLCKQIGPHLLADGARLGASVDQCIRGLDARCWTAAFQFTGLDQYMDAEARREFDASLKRDPAPFTDSAVRATFLDVLPKRDEMFRRGLVNLFRKLSDHYASHREASFQVPGKIIVHGWSGYSFRGGRHVSHYAYPEVDDLDRVLSTLQERRFQPGQLRCDLDRAWERGEDFIGRDIKARAYRNGNAHVWFTNSILLERINEVIANHYGAALGTARSAA